MLHNDLLTLEITNFQSHEKTIVKFAPGGQLTVITGPTDSGKSAIFRALRWLLYNQPQGTDFIRGGCTFVRVAGIYASGHTIIRERTASKNQYRIVAPGADVPVVLEGFGNAVPVEVQEITGVKTVTIGDMDFNLNMAEQLDGPFLGKSISSGTRAKVMGKLAGTEVLDFAGKTVGTDLFRRNQDEKRLEVEVDGLQQMVGEYDYLPTLAAKIAAVDQIVETIKTNKTQWERLFLIKAQIIGKDELIAGCQVTINRWQFVKMAENTVKKILDDMVWVIGHKQTRQELIYLAGLIQTANDTIDRFKNVDTAGDVAAGVTKQVQRMETLSGTKNRLIAFGTVISQCQVIINRFKNVEQANQAVNQANNDFQRLNRVLKLEENLNIVDLGIKRVDNVLQGLTGLDSVEWLTAEAKVKVIQFERLINLKGSNDAINCSIDRINEILNKYSRLADAETYWNTASLIFGGRWAKLAKLIPEIKKLDIAIVDLKGSVVIHEQRVAQLEGAYQDELVEAGVCPTCGAVTSQLKQAS